MKYTPSKDTNVNEYIDTVDEKLKSTFIEVRETILKACPNFEEAIKWKNCLTYNAKKNAIQTVVGKEQITLIFFEGAAMEDKYEVLEGDGKKTRSYRIAPKKLNKATLKALVKQAYAMAE